MRQLAFYDKKERDDAYRALKREGACRLRRWTLRDQEVGYTGFGSERDTRRRSVYMLDVEEKYDV